MNTRPLCRVGWDWFDPWTLVMISHVMWWWWWDSSSDQFKMVTGF